MIRASPLLFLLILILGFIPGGAAQAPLTIQQVSNEVRERYSSPDEQQYLVRLARRRASASAYTEACYKDGQWNQTERTRYADWDTGVKPNRLTCSVEQRICGRALLLDRASKTREMARVYGTINYDSCTKDLWNIITRQDWNALYSLPDKYWAIQNGYKPAGSPAQQSSFSSSRQQPTSVSRQSKNDGYNDIDDLSTDDIAILDDSAPISRPGRQLQGQTARSTLSDGGNSSPLFHAADNACRAEPLPRADHVPDPICICGFGMIDVFGAEAAGGYGECRWGSKAVLGPR